MVIEETTRYDREAQRAEARRLDERDRAATQDWLDGLGSTRTRRQIDKNRELIRKAQAAGDLTVEVSDLRHVNDPEPPVGRNIYQIDDDRIVEVDVAQDGHLRHVHGAETEGAKPIGWVYSPDYFSVWTLYEPGEIGLAKLQRQARMRREAFNEHRDRQAAREAEQRTGPMQAISTGGPFTAWKAHQEARGVEFRNTEGGFGTAVLTPPGVKISIPKWAFRFLEHPGATCSVCGKAAGDYAIAGGVACEQCLGVQKRSKPKRRVKNS